MTYEVITKFKAGDKVRVKSDLCYFDASIRGVEMEVLKVDRFRAGGKEVVQYHTDRPDPVLGFPYNEDELVGHTETLQPREFDVRHLS